MKVLAIYNLKGGVGKTATAVNLACLSVQRGARTLLWDLDPQASATFYFRVEPTLPMGIKSLLRQGPADDLIRATDYPGLHLLPADLRYRKVERTLAGMDRPTHQIARLLQPLSTRYDYLFLDCPPGLSLLADAIFVAADLLLVPTIPTTLSLRALQLLAGHLDQRRLRRLRVLPFHCMVDRRRALHRQIVASPTSAYPFLATTIPYASEVEKMGLHRAPLVCYAPRSPAAMAYGDLWHEIEDQLDPRDRPR